MSLFLFGYIVDWVKAEGKTMIEITGSSLTQCQIAPDGSAVRLNFKSDCGQPASLTLPVECIQQLLMTLPHVASMAIRARYRDETLRWVFSLGSWQLEAARASADVILTLKTPDGFEVAFSIGRQDVKQIACAVDAAGPASEQARTAFPLM